MRLRPYFVALLLGVGWISPANAQTPAPPPVPACEQAVETQYRSLVTDKLVDGSATLWQTQLQILASSLRIQRTQADLKGQRVEVIDQQFATLYEHLRQSREREAALQKELETLRQGQPPTPAN